MIEKVRKFMEEYAMLTPGDTLIAGISGGADSVCLFHILYALSGKMHFSFSAVHVNHGIRGEEAERDAGFVRRLCAQYGVPFSLYSYDVPKMAEEQGLSEEEAGRIVRRRAFEAETEKRGAGKIVLAHHKDDMAETLLLNLCRGSGMEGLAGIRPVRDNVLRPLLCLSKEEILGWLKERKLPYCTDSTNLSHDYARNRVRLDILPVLTQEINKRTPEHMAQASLAAGEAVDFLRAEAAKRKAQYVREVPCREDEDAYGRNGTLRGAEDPSVHPGHTSFVSTGPSSKNERCFSAGTGLFENEPRIMQEMAIRLVLEELTPQLKDISRKHIEGILMLWGKEAYKEIHLPYGITARRAQDGILIYSGRVSKCRYGDGAAGAFTAGVPAAGKAAPAEDTEENLSAGTALLPVPGRLSFGPWRIEASCADRQNETIPENKYTKWFDYDKIKDKLTVRYRRRGDFIVIHPDGRKKSLSDYLTDIKMPRNKRDRTVLLARGSEVLWLPGLRSGESCRVEEKTRRVLEIHFSAEKRI